MTNYVALAMILIVGIYAFVNLVVSDDSLKAESMKALPRVVSSEIIVP